MSEKKHFRVYIPRIIGFVIAGIAIFFIVKAIMGFIDQKPKNEKKIQPITLLKPPPPPPPPKVETPPPPPEEQQKIEEPEPEPEPLPDTPPDEAPARDLGLDAEGTAGSDAFGLAAHKGGTGLFGGGDPFVHYGNQVKSEIMSILSSHDELRRKSYSAIIKVWLKSDGTLDHIEFAKSSSDPELDDTIQRVLDKFKSPGDLPPGIQQPIKIKISSRV